MFTIFNLKFISEISTVSLFKKAFFLRQTLYTGKMVCKVNPVLYPSVERFFTRSLTVFIFSISRIWISYLYYSVLCWNWFHYFKDSCQSSCGGPVQRSFIGTQFVLSTLASQWIHGFPTGSSKTRIDADTDLYLQFGTCQKPFYQTTEVRWPDLKLIVVNLGQSYSSGNLRVLLVLSILIQNPLNKLRKSITWLSFFRLFKNLFLHLM